MHGDLSITIWGLQNATESMPSLLDFLLVYGAIGKPQCSKCEREASHVKEPQVGRAFRCPEYQQWFNGLENTLFHETVAQRAVMCAYFWASNLGFKQCRAMLGVHSRFVAGICSFASFVDMQKSVTAAN